MSIMLLEFDIFLVAIFISSSPEINLIKIDKLLRVLHIVYVSKATCEQYCVSYFIVN